MESIRNWVDTNHMQYCEEYHEMGYIEPTIKFRIWEFLFNIFK